MVNIRHLCSEINQIRHSLNNVDLNNSRGWAKLNIYFLLASSASDGFILQVYS